MKAVRTTVFRPADGDYGRYQHEAPVTLVVTENDIETSAEVFVEEMKHVEADAFAVVETFDIPDDADIAVAAMIATQRAVANAQEEGNMAVLYYYDADMLAHVEEHGVLSTTLPAPLSRWQILYVLRMLKRHPRYRNQTIIVHDRNGEPVALSA